jgi:GTPase-associated protein 1
MSQELFYTSAPRGLQPGSRGFCAVAATPGLSPALAEKLESLSGYRPLFPPHDPRAAQNPVAWSHLRVSVGGRTHHLLSRVGPAGLDYTERTNKFAHHVVLDSGELAAGGPAWMLAQPGFMEPQWDGEVRRRATALPRCATNGKD